MKTLKKQVAIFGIQGSYHQIASERYFAEQPEVIECGSFRDVIASVQNSSQNYGIMAIENTVAGTLLQNLELLRKSGLVIVGEQKLRITHALAVLLGTKMSEIEEICSHSMALLQCQKFLDTIPTVRTSEIDDTATAAKHIQENRNRKIAAICSRRASEIYGLEILAEGIETDKRNFTRFLIIANKDNAKKHDGRTKKNKVSLVFSLPHTPGSLADVLAIFADHGLNLTKLQSYPRIGAEWEYSFYVDLTFPEDTCCQRAIQKVKPRTADFQILGEYAESK